MTSHTLHYKLIALQWCIIIPICISHLNVINYSSDNICDNNGLFEINIKNYLYGNVLLIIAMTILRTMMRVNDDIFFLFYMIDIITIIISLVFGLIILYHNISCIFPDNLRVFYLSIILSIKFGLLISLLLVNCLLLKL
jgi:hypothetical protein